jgi:hypothetical protein
VLGSSQSSRDFSVTRVPDHGRLSVAVLMAINLQQRGLLLGGNRDPGKGSEWFYKLDKLKLGQIG